MNRAFDWLKNKQKIEEVSASYFYRDIWIKDALQKKGEYNRGKYNGIIVEVSKKKLKNGKYKVFRHTITDDHKKIDDVTKRDNFCITSPVSYAGKTREAKNGRFLYAFAIDLDGLLWTGDKNNKKNYHGLKEMFYSFKKKLIQKPNYIVASGSGIHLYYLLEKPIALMNKDVIERLNKIKRGLISKVWRDWITSQSKQTQYQSIFQGMRMPGTITKKGERAKVFKISNKRWSVKDLNDMNNFAFQIDNFNFDYQSKLSLKDAKEKYQKWYEERIVQKKPKRGWKNNRKLYEWWRDKKIIDGGIEVGHRYFYIMMLAIYAKKSGISRKELENDAYGFIDAMERETIDDNNHFTAKDVQDALEAYNDNYLTFPINSIEHLTGKRIEKNKRNFRKQKEHLKIARFTRDLKHENWRINNGRPKGQKDKKKRKEYNTNKKEIIVKWRERNPLGKKIKCFKETKITRPTINKYWNLN